MNMPKMEDVIPVVLTCATVVLAITGANYFVAGAAEARSQAELNRIARADSIIKAGMYKPEVVNPDDLAQMHPLGPDQIYAAVDSTGAGDEEHKIMFTALDMIEFAEHGLTRNLKQKIKVIPDRHIPRGDDGLCVTMNV
jgi:hypothetical protein